MNGRRIGPGHAVGRAIVHRTPQNRVADEPRAKET
jgi:hypothetical protein